MAQVALALKWGKLSLRFGEFVLSYALRWAPYYVVKYGALLTVKQYGAPRVYRRLLEVNRAMNRDRQWARRRVDGLIREGFEAPGRFWDVLTDFEVVRLIQTVANSSWDGPGPAGKAQKNAPVRARISTSARWLVSIVDAPMTQADNSHRRKLTAEEHTIVRHCFDDIDSDKDGRISIGGLSRALELASSDLDKYHKPAAGAEEAGATQGERNRTRRKSSKPASSSLQRKAKKLMKDLDSSGDKHFEYHDFVDRIELTLTDEPLRSLGDLRAHMQGLASEEEEDGDEAKARRRQQEEESKKKPGIDWVKEGKFFLLTMVGMAAWHAYRHGMEEEEEEEPEGQDGVEAGGGVETDDEAKGGATTTKGGATTKRGDDDEERRRFK